MNNPFISNDMKELTAQQIYELGMKAFDQLLEDYGDVLEALAKDAGDPGF